MTFFNQSDSTVELITLERYKVNTTGDVFVLVRYGIVVKIISMVVNALGILKSYKNKQTFGMTISFIISCANSNGHDQLVRSYVNECIAKTCLCKNYISNISKPYIYIYTWAASAKTYLLIMCAKRRLKSACASAQSDQSLRCSNEDPLHPRLSKMRQVKILIGPIWILAGRTLSKVRFLMLYIIFDSYPCQPAESHP